MLGVLRERGFFVLVAAVAVGGMLSACVPTPEVRHQAYGRVDVHKIDLMPVDFYVHLDDVEDPPNEGERVEVQEEIVHTIEAYTRRFLSSRGYSLGNRITWDGAPGERGYVSGQVLEQIANDMLDFINQEADAPHQAWARHQGPKSIPADALGQLTAATGSDAVLYINGKASVESRAKRTQKTIVAVCCFVATAALLFLMFKSAGSSSSSRNRGPRRVGRAPAHHTTVHVGFFGPVFIHNDHRRPGSAYEGTAEVEGNHLWLSFTLAKAKTGEILWHARTVVDLDASDREQLEGVLGDLLASFPASN